MLNKIGFQGLSTAFQFRTTITFPDALKKEHTAVSTHAPSNREYNVMIERIISMFAIHVASAEYLKMSKPKSKSTRAW